MSEMDLAVVCRSSPEHWEQLVQLAVEGIANPNTLRAYSHSVRRFLAWCAAESISDLNRSAVQRFRAFLETEGFAPATINQSLAAVRHLAEEARQHNLLTEGRAHGVRSVHGVKALGTRTGRWLLPPQAQSLIETPPANTLIGKRDRALLGLLVGAGLRRAEIVSLQLEQVEKHGNRWVLANVRGKGGRIRTVPIAPWAKKLIDNWTTAAGITAGPLFRHIRKLKVDSHEPLSSQWVYGTVVKYANAAGLGLAPHDCRRTFARLAHEGRASMTQIQQSLGHNSVVTTERYVGAALDLEDAPCDHLGIAEISGEANS